MYLTSEKEGILYTGQITSYGSSVYAEILNNHESFYRNDVKCYLSTQSKRFGKWYNSDPTKEDWVKANDWVKNQLELIREYGTVTIEKPEWMKERARLQKELNK